jgi:hypothetical protein
MSASSPITSATMLLGRQPPLPLGAANRAGGTFIAAA